MDDAFPAGLRILVPFLAESTLVGGFFRVRLGAGLVFHSMPPPSPSSVDLKALAVLVQTQARLPLGKFAAFCVRIARDTVLLVFQLDFPAFGSCPHALNAAPCHCGSSWNVPPFSHGCQ